MNVARRLFAFMLPSLLLLAACRTPAEAPGTPSSGAAQEAYQQDLEERDAVLAALETMKQDALLNAFSGLPRYRYTRYTRTEQYDTAHHRTAFTEQVARIGPRDGQHTHTVLQADSAGSPIRQGPAIESVRLDDRAFPLLKKTATT